MRNLHAIIVGTIEAWVWGYAYGANGRLLGQGQGGQPVWRGNGLSHAYLIPRGTPPAPVRQGQWSVRRYWNPWNGTGLSHEQMLTPACGRIRTQSRSPRFEMPGSTPRNQCPDCVRIVGNITTYTELQAADPWRLIRIDERETAIDPVSGL